MKKFFKTGLQLLSAVLIIATTSTSSYALPDSFSQTFSLNTDASYTAPKIVPIEPDAATVTIVGAPESIRLEEGFSISAQISYQGSPTRCRAGWTINNQPIAGTDNRDFFLFDGRSVTVNLSLTKEQAPGETATLGFVLISKGTEFAKAQTIVKVIPAKTEEEKRAEEREYILNLVKPVKVEAVTARDATLYSDVMLTKKSGFVSAGTPCQVLSSKTGYSNKILLPDGTVSWISLRNLNISTKNYTVFEDISNVDKDLFVRTMGYESATDYLIWVHLERQKVNIFMRKDGRWCIERVYPCSSGANQTPTINGIFTYNTYQDRWNYADYYVGPVMIFSGNYALHSVLMRYNGTVYDGTLGTPASHGCVRMDQTHIQWMAENIPMGTTVVIH